MESPITITGCAGNASATSTVEVHIVHTYIGDLVVNLVAPDGSAYLLHNRTGGSADNIDQTYTVNLSSEVANGTWRLRVQDAASVDTGFIDTLDAEPRRRRRRRLHRHQRHQRDDPRQRARSNSPITISGCTGNASATSTVEVHIVHTCIGDLVVSLVAPDGSRLRAAQPDRRQRRQHQPDLHGQPVQRGRNGTWNLRVAGRRRRQHRLHRQLDPDPLTPRSPRLSGTCRLRGVETQQLPGRCGDHAAPLNGGVPSHR